MIKSALVVAHSSHSCPEKTNHTNKLIYKQMDGITQANANYSFPKTIPEISDFIVIYLLEL